MMPPKRASKRKNPVASVMKNSSGVARMKPLAGWAKSHVRRVRQRQIRVRKHLVATASARHALIALVPRVIDQDLRMLPEIVVPAPKAWQQADMVIAAPALRVAQVLVIGRRVQPGPVALAIAARVRKGVPGLATEVHGPKVTVARVRLVQVALGIVVPVHLVQAVLVIAARVRLVQVALAIVVHVRPALAQVLPGLDLDGALPQPLLRNP